MTQPVTDAAKVLPWFDIKSAILGAVLMSSLVGLVNASHGLAPALIAAAKQGAYTFFVAGFIMQLCRYLAQRQVQAYLAIAGATLVPTIVTVLAVYAVHSFRGTPEPLLSTMVVAVLGLVSFFLVSWNIVRTATDTEVEAG